MDHSESITGAMIRKRLEHHSRNASPEDKQEVRKEIDDLFSDRSTKEERYHYFHLGKLYFLNYMGMGYFLLIPVFLLNLAMFGNNPFINYFFAIPASISFCGYLAFNSKEKANTVSAASYTKFNLLVTVLGGLILAGAVALFTQLI